MNWQLDISSDKGKTWETIATKGYPEACKVAARAVHRNFSAYSNGVKLDSSNVWYRLYDDQGRLSEVSCDNDRRRMVWGPGNLKLRAKQGSPRDSPLGASLI